MTSRLLGLLAIIALAGCSRSKPDFAAFVDEYAAASNRWSPTGATDLGFHEYDAQIEDRSAAAYKKRSEILKAELAQLTALRQGELTAQEAIDAELLDSSIRAEILELDTMKSWQSNPMEYVGLPGSAVDSLMMRNFAPPAERLRSLTARLAGVPAILTAMKENVSNPPKEFTDLSIRMASGSVGFFNNEVAAWAKDAAGGDTAALEAFTKANAAAAESMNNAVDWLQSDLLPRSKGSYAIGTKNFETKLRYEEMVDIPIDQLLAIGEATLNRDYQALMETAKQIDPKRPPVEVIKHLSDEHPSAADLIPFCKKTVEGTRQFVLDKKIVTIPSMVLPIVRDTPPYARSGSFASMSTPGPFETKATEAYYYVTPPEKGWSATQTEEFMRLFREPLVRMITVHEAYPGHYLQFLYVPQVPTKTRKLVGSASNAEGWAHYTEQMMIEEGFGNGDPRLHAAQLQEAILRDCRYVAGIKLHTQGWTVEQATQLFMDKTLHQRAVAFEEARRGTYNPTYLYYTLGKLMIYKLRGDYQKAKGSAYSLTQFHNEFVKQGPIALKVVRQIMLPGDHSPQL
jgi:uncharacterized protein (DUF885 family)